MPSALCALADTELMWHEPLSRHTTFRVGGPVQYLARPITENALRALMEIVRKEGIPHLVLGGGSNVLAPDSLVDVLAIQLARCCSTVSCNAQGPDEVQVYVGAGVRLARWLQFCVQKGLGGIECLVGIPGTVGGALVMNAGTREGSISDALVSIDLIDEGGTRRRLDKSDLTVHYRSLGLPEGSMVLGATFRLRSVSAAALRGRMLHSMRQRKRTQPIGWPSAGCIFKNPPGHFAGALIERCGLKGFRIGGAEVSEKHANWIVNKGDARAEDILALIRHIEAAVCARFGVRLEREIRVLGPGSAKM